MVGDTPISFGGSYSAMTWSLKKCYTCITLLVEKRQVLDKPLSSILDASFSLMISSVPNLISVSSDSLFALKTPRILHAEGSHSSVWGATRGFLPLSHQRKSPISMVCFLSLYINQDIIFLAQIYNIYSNYLYVYSVPPAHYVIYLSTYYHVSLSLNYIDYWWWWGNWNKGVKRYKF